MARHEPVNPADDPHQVTEEDWAASPIDEKAPFSRVGFTPLGLAMCAVTLAVVGVAMFGFLTIMGEPLVAFWFMLPMLLCALFLYMASVRRRLRNSVSRSLAKVAAQHLLLPSIAYVEVDARRWRRGLIGVPMVVNIRYAAEARPEVGGGAAGLAGVVQKELGHPMVVQHDKSDKRQVTLRHSRNPTRQLGPAASGMARRSSAAHSGHLPTKIDRPIPAGDPSQNWLIPIGVDGSGTIAGWNPQSPQGHLLVLGRAGAGKQVLLTGLIIEVASRGWPVWVIDHRRVDLLGIRDWPNVQIVASSLDDQMVVLNQTWREMEGRISMIESGSRAADLEPLIVVIHHFRDFVSAVADAAERAEAGTPGATFAWDRVADLLRHGRSVNILLVLSIQGTSDPLLEPKFRETFGAVVALGRVDSTAATTLWGSDGSEELSEPIPGRAVIRAGEAAPIQIQCYWTPDPREVGAAGDEQGRYLVGALQPKLTTHHPLTIRRPPAATSGPAAMWKANMAAELSEGAMRSGALADWGMEKTAKKGRATAGGNQASGWSELVMVSQLEPGNLIRLDDEHGWVIVESADPIEHDGTRIRILWRGADGAGSVDVLRTRTVRLRHLSDGGY